MTINAIPENNREASFRIWATPGFLPETLGMFVDQNGEVGCLETNVDNVRGVFGIYDLVGFVAQIYSKKDRKSHLVSLVNGRMIYLDQRAQRPRLTLM